MSKITVLYFAGVKDITQKDQETIELGHDWTLSRLSDFLVSQYGPKLNQLLTLCMYAVNMDYVEKEKESTTIIQPNSEIAIIPPVSGG
ncbi:molybdopterin converting factor, small subunit [Blakeslea trispora]|nr:molybdopterin converting factor, small subunit [Blakeslea trispora]